jgi:hypothetical protein
LLALFVLIAVPAPAAAQETGSISGTVTDVDGAPLPGVMITVDGALIPTATTYTRANGTYRFAALPPASDYALSFELQGFQKLVQDQLIVRLGGDTQIGPQLALSAVEELVVVSGATPLVDVKNTGTGANIDERYMQSIPAARDPWTMLQHTSGVQTNSPNVGGSESGQQQQFQSHGTKHEDTMWNYDGADIGASGAGASPTYYDFDAFEEIQISTGGNDASIQTGGIRLNFVTKRGGNAWRGSGRFYHTDGAWQGYTVGDPETGELVGNYTADELWPGYIGDSIDTLQDFGAELGGPIVQDRLFGWGAYGRQLVNTRVGIQPDNTQLTNWHAKANWHLGDSTVANFTFMQGRKTAHGVGAGARRPEETTWNQDGTSPSYTLKLQHTVNDNHYFEASLNHFPGGWGRDPIGGTDTQTGYDLATGVWSNTVSVIAVTQLSNSARIDGSSYVAGSSMDHEFKYGASFRHTNDTARESWPQGGFAAFIQGRPYEAWMIQDWVENNQGDRYAFHAADTMSAGRLTLNVGLRFDHQSANLQPSSAPASPIVPEFLPALQFPGFDPGFSWNSLSPRFGMTYALNDNATTILRFNAARYYSQLRNWEFSHVNTTRGNEVDFQWSDTNGNSLVDPGETGAVRWISPGYDPANPTDPSLNVVTETSPPWTNELIVGIEHEINRTLGVGANVIYRKHGDFTWAPRAGSDDPNAWEQVTQIVPGYGELNVYQPTEQLAPNTVYQTRSGYGESHTGVEFYLTKRFSDRWMANASFNFGDTVENYSGPGSYTDPTNIQFRNGQPQFNGSRFGTWGASRWNAKASAMVQLPAGFSLATFLQAREGGINPQTVRSNNRPNGAGRVDALVENFGTSRLPTFWSLDLRGEKTFDVSDRGRIHIIVDAFNITNNDIILGQEGRINSSLNGRITEVLQGRTIRLGVRLVLR